jgi:hypothetical protein
MFFCRTMLMNAHYAAIHHQVFQVGVSRKRCHDL